MTVSSFSFFIFFRIIDTEHTINEIIDTKHNIIVVSIWLPVVDIQYYIIR
jgi:hypothetical protein